MLKRRRHAVDLVFGQAVPRGFVAPLRDGLADLLGYFAGLGGVQIEIPRDLKGQSEGGGVVVLVDRRG